MGIHYFFYWLRNRFPEHITPILTGNVVSADIDTLLLDMNGIFHNSAQKIYKYGSCKESRFLPRHYSPQNLSDNAMMRHVFADVCRSIEKLIYTTKPRHRLVLCIDGPAPLAKMCQQRTRRYKSVKENSITPETKFNPNSITPGTVFMDRLSQYIDWYIRKKLTENDPLWSGLEVIFSNEKHPAEGEHKAMSFVRKYASENEVFCINGMDADLLMISMATHHENFYILRDENFERGIEYKLIDVKNLRRDIIEELRWSNDESLYKPKYAINDFVYFCFMCGNDFLPHMPSIEIIESGIELIISVYKEVCKRTLRHLTTEVTKKDSKDGEMFTIVSPHCLSLFLERIGQYEKEMFERKLNSKTPYFKDEYLSSCATQQGDDGWVLDIDKYRNGYMEKYFGSNKETLEQICHKYIEGTQWVLFYYTKGVPCWKWFYPYPYAPLASMIAKHVKTFIPKIYPPSYPSKPFQQLLCVLPPQSSTLLPEPLQYLLVSPESPIKSYYPDDFEIDLSGKKKEYQGIPIIPVIDFNDVVKAYNQHENALSDRDKKRNICGCAFIYQKSHSPTLFKSFYGDIPNCNVFTKKFLM